MKGYFYHNSIRKYILLMGNLFSGIYVARGDAYRKVPITVSSKEHFVAALNSQELNGDGNMALVATKLPRIGLDMVSCTYDSTRKTNVTNRKLTRDLSADRPAMNKLFNPVPYDFEFEVSVYTRHQDDAFQIIEQILPYFQPQFNTMIKELNESEVLIDERDIPIILESAVPETTFEGSAGEMRHIEWTLNMRLKGWLYPPTNVQFGEIRTIYLDFNEEEKEIIHAEREPVSNTTVLAYAIREAIGLDSTVAWRSSIDSMMGMSWNTRAELERDVDIDWFRRPQITSEYDILANIRNSMQSDIVYDWGTSPVVDSDMNASWNIRSDVGVDTDIDWYHMSSVHHENVVAYDHLAVIGSSSNVQWDSGDVVDSEIGVDWNVRESAVREFNLTYESLGTVFNDFGVNWNAAGLVSNYNQQIFFIGDRIPITNTLDVDYIIE
ncbi:tail sheath stabilizer and completion protein [Vibrio phage 6E35.1a]|nr:tail sheath stabilizer and completion protein [Vibrio phage 6E35.1a]